MTSVFSKSKGGFSAAEEALIRAAERTIIQKSTYGLQKVFKSTEYLMEGVGPPKLTYGGHGSSFISGPAFSLNRASFISGPPSSLESANGGNRASFISGPAVS